MLELRHYGDLVSLVVEGSWFNLPDGSTISPAMEGWSNDSGYVLLKHTPAPEPAPEIDLYEYAANRRWLKETSGIQFGGFNVATDDRSKLMIIGARAAADKDPTFTTNWKLPDNTFVVLNAMIIIAISDAVLEHVAECFSIEEQVISGISDGSITTTAQIDTAFL